LKGNDSKMPFPLIFHYFMHPPGTPRAGRADDKPSKGNEKGSQKK